MNRVIKVKYEKLYNKKLLYIGNNIYVLEILKNASTTIRKLIEGGSEDLHNYPFINELIYTPKLDLTNKKLL